MLYRKTQSINLPDNATVTTRRTGEQIASWVSNGRKQSGVVMAGDDGILRVVITWGAWRARFRAADDTLIDKSTKCRDRSAAESVLKDWQAQEEKIRAGIVTPSELRTAAHGKRGLGEHIEEYTAHLEARNTSAHAKTTGGYLKRLADGCGWDRLGDLDRTRAEKWLASWKEERGASNRSYNAQVAAWVSFGNWLSRAGRVPTNPFQGMRKLNEKADRRREAKAMTDDQVAALIDAARKRPLHDFLTKNRGRVDVSDETRDRLTRRGEERAVVYMTAFMTGLRMNEIRTLRVGDLALDAAVPVVTLSASNTKNRRDSVLPLHPDLVSALKAWLPMRLEGLRDDARREGKGEPVRLTADMPVFSTVPNLKAFNLDLAYAGLDKHDGHGRVLHRHGLRHSFITALGRAGVPLATAQRLARHSDPKLTSGIYTHLEAVDLAGAVGRLVAPEQKEDNLEAKAAENGGGKLPLILPLASVKMAPCVSSKDISMGVRECTASQVHGDRNSPKNKAFHELSSGDKVKEGGGDDRDRTDDLMTASHTVSQNGASVNHCASKTYEHSENWAADSSTNSSTRYAKTSDLDQGNTASMVWVMVDAATAWLWGYLGESSTVPTCAMAGAV